MKITSIKDILGEDLYQEYLKTMSMHAETDMCQFVPDEIPACPLDGCHLTIPTENHGIKIDWSFMDVAESVLQQSISSSRTDFHVTECLEQIDEVSMISKDIIEKQKSKIEIFRNFADKIPEMYATFIAFYKGFQDVSSQKSLQDGFPREIWKTFQLSEKLDVLKYEKIENFTESLDYSDIKSFCKSLLQKLLILRNIVRVDSSGKSSLDISIIKQQFEDHKKFIRRMYDRKTIEKWIIDFCNSCDVLDTTNTEKTILQKISSVGCVAKNLQKLSLESITQNESLSDKDDDNDSFNLSFLEVSKDPDSYDFLKPQYWKRFTKYLNVISLLPTYWTTGIVIPPSTPIKLPIIHKFIVVIPVMSIGKIFVVWLTINGIVVFPIVLEIDFKGSVSSTWKTLFRGASIPIKQGGGSFIQNMNLGTETSNGGSSIVDQNPEKFSINTILSDDYPPMERMGLSNPHFLLFLNLMMQKQTPYQGLPV